MKIFPTDGGTAVDVAGAEGYAIVSEPVATVFTRVSHALAEMQRVGSSDEEIWVELTTLADPDEELPRRQTWVRADKVIGMTYMSDEQIEKYESEIS